MKISILTLFPEMFQGPFDFSIVKRAIDRKLINLAFINIRDFGIGRHKMVDDKPYGGGKGMILKVDVVANALEKAKDNSKKQKIVLLTPSGKTFNQRTAEEYSKLDHLILICGHYEGVDARVDKLVDEKISIGDFILTGGEIPAMLIVDSVTRLIKGTLKEGVTQNESFSTYLEHPQYTNPRVYKNHKVPDVLLSGDHEKIKEWKESESLKTTSKTRPDLIRKMQKK